MTTSDSSGGPPGPPDGPQRNRRMSLRRKVSLKFKEFQGFVNEYSENVSTGGMFVRTPSPQPDGTVFDFEFTLGDGYTLIHGIGEVVWTREEDEGFDRPAGMGVRFLSLDPNSRKLIDRMVEERLDREARRVAPPPAESDRPWGDLSPVEGAVAAAWDEAPEGKPSPEADLERPPLLFPSEAAQADDAASRRTGPSPYVYARSYQGSGVSTRHRRARPLLVVLLAIALIVAALSAFFLFFPETAVRLLVGGDRGGDDRLVEVRPTSSAGAPANGAPVQPVEPVPRSQAAGVPEPTAQEAPEGAAPEGTAATGGSGAGEDEAAGEAGDEELGFFAARGQPAGKGRAPEESRRATPAPAPAPRSLEGAGTSAAFSRVLNIVWEERGEELLVTVFLDGAIEEWDYSTVRVQSPPRELVRIDGVDHPFPRTEILVGTGLLERIRIGFHPEGRTSQLHVVLDLATPKAQLDRTEAAGSELRLFLSRGDG